MKNEFALCGLILLIAPSFGLAQKLWDITPGPDDIAAVAGDTSIAILTAIVQRTDLRTGSVPMEFVSAGEILAHNAREAWGPFVLGRWKDFGNPRSPLFTWERFFRFQQLRGYLGDSGAIAGMDSVARLASDPQLKLSAMRCLAEAGRYDHFEELKKLTESQDPLTFPSAISLLGRYGRDARFREEAGTLLRKILAASTDYSSASASADALAGFDRTGAIALLEQRFRGATGNDREQFFVILGRIDPAGQPERTIGVAPKEPDPFLRALYYPTMSSIMSGSRTRRYLDPFFVRFALKESKTERSVPLELRDFLNDFQPLPPFPRTTGVEMLDSLVALTDTMAAYGWVGDESSVQGLHAELTDARSALEKGDTAGCAAKIRQFQAQVNEEYTSSSHAVIKSITREGWKYLFYNASFVLSRLATFAAAKAP